MRGTHKIVPVAALTAIKPVADGTSAIVPSKPNDEMINAGEDESFRRDRELGTTHSFVRAIYNAMLSAAPDSAPSPQDRDEVVMERVAADMHRDWYDGTWETAGLAYKEQFMRHARVALEAMEG